MLIFVGANHLAMIALVKDTKIAINVIPMTIKLLGF